MRACCPSDLLRAERIIGGQLGRARYRVLTGFCASAALPRPVLSR
jgi:hypothetical protein